MERSILATDLSRYFARLPEFKAVMADESLQNSSAVDFTYPSTSPLSSTAPSLMPECEIARAEVWKTIPAKRELLASMMMTACDVSASTKPWPVQKKVGWGFKSSNTYFFHSSCFWRLYTFLPVCYSAVCCWVFCVFPMPAHHNNITAICPFFLLVHVSDSASWIQVRGARFENRKTWPWCRRTVRVLTSSVIGRRDCCALICASNFADWAWLW